MRSPEEIRKEINDRLSENARNKVDPDLMVSAKNANGRDLSLTLGDKVRLISGDYQGLEGKEKRKVVYVSLVDKYI